MFSPASPRKFVRFVNYVRFRLSRFLYFSLSLFLSLSLDDSWIRDRSWLNKFVGKRIKPQLYGEIYLNSYRPFRSLIRCSIPPRIRSFVSLSPFFFFFIFSTHVFIILKRGLGTVTARWNKTDANRSLLAIGWRKGKNYGMSLARRDICVCIQLLLFATDDRIILVALFETIS